MGIHVNNDNVNRAIENLGCLVLKAPFMFLGSIVGGDMHRLSMWKDMIDRFRRRLSKWKMKMLSIRGRYTLVKSVLGSMPIFQFSLFKAPSGILKTLESIRSHFFNGHDVSSKKISRVNWNKVIAPKDKGGLGVSSLYALNMGLLFKWIWRFLTQGSSLWAKVVKAIHEEDGNIGSNCKGGSKSCWSSIVTEVKTLENKGIDLMQFLKIKMGNEDSIRLWEDPWHEDGILKIRFPRIYALELRKSINIEDKLGHHNLSKSFRRFPRGGAELSQFGDFAMLLQQVSRAPTADRWAWTRNSSGEFTVASVRQFIDDKLCVDVEGVPMHAWSSNTFHKIGSMWVEVLELGDCKDECFARKRLCIKTNRDDNILEKFKIIVKGKSFVVRAKELFMWSPSFVEVTEVDDTYEEGKFIQNREGGLEKPIHQTNVEEESDIEVISETFFGDQADDLNEVVDSAQQSIPKETAYDPFNIYDILTKENKDVNATATNLSILFPPGFTPNKPDTDVGEPVAQKDQFQPDVKS
nr:RNA-directed DNA polymerase, eukaryota, reverse transcriptase zinc-binding domain protein [Tanacetum cinerariifolium]